MTTREKLQDRGINLNTIILVFGILGGIFTAIRLGGPIVNMPERSAAIEQRIGAMASEVSEIQTVQTVQAEALRQLTELAATSNDTRRETDRHSAEIAEIRRRLDRLEAK